MNFTVAVRALCEFTAKQGDLDLRFTPSPSAQEGIAGHAAVALRRGASLESSKASKTPESYQAEVTLEGSYKHLRVRGRADGYDPVRRRLDEVKTYRGRLDAMPANHRLLHWAQVKVYGALLCRQLDLPEVDLALVYFDIGSKQETVLTLRCGAAELQHFFEDQCERFLDWSTQELAHRHARDQALRAMAFPHGSFRTGQRELAEAVYKAAVSGRCLMAQAPTGIGKTIGTLFPLLKAVPGQALDKVFFLAAKTSGRRMALDALDRIQQATPGLPLRVIELVARDKACEHPDKACHGDACPLARGFYDRLPAARASALHAGALDKACLREVALTHQVCPYYLSQELVRWSDVVVGDYNYYFDLNAMLHGLSQSNQWRTAVLVDEAHNLVGRARKMYTAELHRAGLGALRRSAPPGLLKPLNRLNQCWAALEKPQPGGVQSTDPAITDYRVVAELPDAWRSALQQAVSAITDHLTDYPTSVDEPLQSFYFNALHFSRVLESFDRHSLLDLTGAGSRHAVLCVRNIVPAPFLRPRFEAAVTTALFSATLRPRRFHADTLGLPDNTAWIDVASPFSAEQLQVRIASGISTRYQHRSASLEGIARLMATQHEERPGNYLAFFSSHQYLHDAAELFESRYPGIDTWRQSRGMAEPERDAFLARFREGGRGIGFAVLGGAFAEGIDLPGDRLIGAFIATLGLPQVNPVNEEIRRRMHNIFGAGWDYTYLYPGLQKVVQAAGRVIRTPSDRGVVHLIDDRFTRPEVLNLLPSWWNARP